MKHIRGARRISQFTLFGKCVYDILPKSPCLSIINLVTGQRSGSLASAIDVTEGFSFFCFVDWRDRAVPIYFRKRNHSWDKY